MNYPSTQFAPFFPDLVLLLLTQMTEAQTYVVLCKLIKQRDAYTRPFICISESDFTFFCESFDDLVAQPLPAISKHMKSIGLSSCMPFSKAWFSSMFVGHVKYSTALRILDCFLNEGNKVLYRIGIGILLQAKPYLLKTTNAEDFLKTLLQAALYNLDATRLFKCAFGMQLAKSSSTALAAMDRGRTSPPRPSEDIRLSEDSRNSVFYRPTIETPSIVVSDSQFELLWSYIPQRFAIMDPHLLYVTERDGFSLATVFSKSRSYCPLLIIIKTLARHIFGAFITTPLSDLGQSLTGGDGECFLWSIWPKVGQYCWTPNAQNTQFVVTNSTATTLIFGHGRNGPGIELDQELHGVSGASQTYNNPQLAETPNFTVAALEVFAFA
eukprot:TRINITY_DN3737_c0_g1_i3.p1 TRINITY_DN3737_c0_g1~~TRINITY_DN3737_c0_g1_i3.p1  ORF type:complete len:382 (-),score=94.97 TRINITY_DN3737_c0_g1_i3:74-1219(-)